MKNVIATAILLRNHIESIKGAEFAELIAPASELLDYAKGEELDLSKSSSIILDFAAKTRVCVNPDDLDKAGRRCGKRALNKGTDQEPAAKGKAKSKPSTKGKPKAKTTAKGKTKAETPNKPTRKKRSSPKSESDEGQQKPDEKLKPKTTAKSTRKTREERRAASKKRKAQSEKRKAESASGQKKLDEKLKSQSKSEPEPKLKSTQTEESKVGKEPENLKSQPKPEPKPTESGRRFSGEAIFEDDEEDLGDMSLPLGSPGRGMTAEETLNVLRMLKMLEDVKNASN
jgi:hypothetical protein